MAIWAASYGVFWKKKTFLAEELEVDAKQLRPNGLLLSYPVITSGPKAHRDSFKNLLGDQYDNLVDEMSLEISHSRYTENVSVAYRAGTTVCR